MAHLIKEISSLIYFDMASKPFFGSHLGFKGQDGLRIYSKIILLHL